MTQKIRRFRVEKGRSKISENRWTLLLDAATIFVLQTYFTSMSKKLKI